MKYPLILTLLATTSLALSACGTTSSTATGSYSPNKETPSYNKANTVEDRAMERALRNAKSDQERLVILEQMYKREPENKNIAITYARALRDDEQINQSQRVLDPLVQVEKPDSAVVTEMAMTELALGQFKKAELTAQRATEINPKDGRAYLAMGTAMDAQGNHEDAEIAFREGLKNWQGDPAPVLNNLALNLASQGRLEQALDILKKAKEESPNRMEIERNYRIISTLLETAGTPPPAPAAKPTS